MKLVELITQYRADHGLSQRQFAQQCGLSNGYVSMIERGINPATGKPITPTFPQLKKFAAGMGLTVMELFDRVDDMPIDLPVSTKKPSLLPQDCSPLKLTSEEVDLIKKYRCLDGRGKSAVLNVLVYEYDSLPGDKANPAPKQA